MKNRYLKLMTVIIAVSCLSMTACGSNRESGAVSKEEQISESMDMVASSADTESGNAQSEDENEPATVSEPSDEATSPHASVDENQNGTAVSLGDFIGDYKGINPFYVIDWTTYEMSEDVDHSFLSVVKKEDGYEVKDINIDSTSPKRHMTLEPIFLKDSDVSYYLDTDSSGGDDYWDCFLLEMDDADIIFSKWRKNGQLMVTIDLGDGSPLMFISK